MMLDFLTRIFRFFKITQFFNFIGIDISKVYFSVIGLPYFFKTCMKVYTEKDENFKKKKMYAILSDFKDSAGDVQNHYFHQDLLVAKFIYKEKPFMHVDVGSRLDGFIAHVLTFMPMTMVDVRPLQSEVEGLTFSQGIAENMLGFKDCSIESLSCLHALEHFGLGRYGDPVDLQAIYKASKEFYRVLKDGGRLYFSVPITKENTICFNAHRIFNPRFVVEELFETLELLEMHCIDDANKLHMNTNYATMEKNKFGCGIFVFEKKV